MDVHAIELHTGFSLPGRGPTTRRKRRPNPDSPSAPAKGGGADPEARSTVSTRRLLLAYTAASILLGLGALAWTTVTIPLLPAIDPGFDGHITLEMANFGNIPVELRAEVDRPAQLILVRLTSPLGDAEAYGSGEADTFQYQEDPIPRGRGPRPPA